MHDAPKRTSLLLVNHTRIGDLKDTMEILVAGTSARKHAGRFACEGKSLLLHV
jgi:hypothetical protein